MVPGDFIDTFLLGMYVMHPSLLPKYRGACPIQHAILNRDSETGVSVIEISKDRFDAGKILAQTRVPLTPETRFDQLSPQLSALGGQLLANICKDDQKLTEYKKNAVEQATLGKSTRAPLLKGSFGEIIF